MLYTTGDSYFAECRQHSAKALLHLAKALPSAALGKESVGKELFAECQILGTWQRLCRVPSQHSAKKTATVNLTASLPTADVADTRQGIFFLFFFKISLPSADPSTRQRGLLCRVPRGRHSAKKFFFFFF